MSAATREPAPGVVPLSQKLKLNGRKAPKSSTNAFQPKLHTAASSSESKLPKPLGPGSRRALAQKTWKLMRMRNELDRALLAQAFRPLDELGARDWLPREELLRQCEHMVSRERDYMRTTTEELAKRAQLYNQDPSEERALDLDLIRTQLWKFKRHLGPYLEATENARGDGKQDGLCSGSNSEWSVGEAKLVQDKTGGCGRSPSAEANAADGHTGREDPSIGLDGAFDDTRISGKRKNSDLEHREGPRKKARKEQVAGRTQPGAPQTHCAEASAPARSKEMEASLAQIYGRMSQSKSSEVKISGASKVPVREAPVDATTKGAHENADRKAPSTPASSSSSSRNSGINGINNEAVRPFYQLHAKAMLRPDFNDFVYERPPHRRRPKTKKKHKEYLVSGALPVPHLPSPKPDKAQARRASADGP
jgi:hypothetical protein